MTRGETSPKNKPRIFFSCHPDDLHLYLNEVSEEIFDYYNATIWYEKIIPSAKDDCVELLQMQLFVIPITAKFLLDSNHSREIELPFALKNNIPVLPIMLESGLELLFAQKCGDLQFLDKNTIDVTAIPYRDKLKKYLDNVLLGDNQIAKNL